MTCASGPYSCRMNTQPSSAPTATMPSSMPSSTRCGWVARISRSLNVPGSDSSALQITYFGLVSCAATRSHLRPVGNAGAAHAAQSGVLEGGDDGRHVPAAAQHVAQHRVPVPRRRVRIVRPYVFSGGTIPQISTAGGAARPRAPGMAAATAASAMLSGTGASFTVHAGAMSQRPRQDPSTTSTSGSAPYRSLIAAMRSSAPRSQQDRSWQTRSSAFTGGSVRKCG